MAITIPAPQPIPMTTVASPHAQLDALVVLATGQLNEQLMPMITRLVGVMLDITDPATPKALWEFCNSGYCLNSSFSSG